MSFDIKQLRRDVDGFNGRFFYDAERGDIGYIGKDCDDRQCDCERKVNADGDQDCSVSLFDDTGEVDDVGEPVARMLNALPAALARIEELERALEEAARWIEALRSVILDACSLLDDAVQLRDDADYWFPKIAALRLRAGVESNYDKERDDAE